MFDWKSATHVTPTRKVLMIAQDDLVALQLVLEYLRQLRNLRFVGCAPSHAEYHVKQAVSTVSDENGGIGAYGLNISLAPMPQTYESKSFYSIDTACSKGTSFLRYVEISSPLPGGDDVTRDCTALEQLEAILFLLRSKKPI